ncbi:MAG: hypothetical protein GEU90_06685 [Gemmatimonas sp.]|nr:hypothetical protein [Gemmatimonas sp.]
MARRLLGSGDRTVVWEEAPVFLSCNYEELQALATGAELLLDHSQVTTSGAVAAPAESTASVAQLRPRLTSPLNIETLAEQRWVRKAVAAICRELHTRMDGKVLEFHPGHEEAVSLYFDYAHTYSVLSRLDEMGSEMTAIIELITGQLPTEESAHAVHFPE